MFCNKQGVQILAMEDNYMPYGKSACYALNQTDDDHFRTEIYIGIVDLFELVCLKYLYYNL